MLYRPYQPADFAPLYAVEELCFQPPDRFPRAYMRRLVTSTNASTWIAEENAELTGFAIVEWTTMPKGTIAYIQTIEIHPDLRRRGIAAELLRRAEDSARAAGAQAIWLHVDAGNAAAILLYERRGYARQGREEHYYARHRPALIYAKQLPIASASKPAP
ncbi:MAG: GNAT family N-acetyltransferase [Terracidiphilus sp.]